MRSARTMRNWADCEPSRCVVHALTLRLAATANGSKYSDKFLLFCALEPAFVHSIHQRLDNRVFYFHKSINTPNFDTMTISNSVLDHVKEVDVLIAGGTSILPMKQTEIVSF